MKIFKIEHLRNVAKSHQADEFVFPNSKGKVLVDATTASVCVQVLDAVKDDELRDHIADVVSSSKDKFLQFVNKCWECTK